jgi:hypothetical protein
LINSVKIQLHNCGPSDDKEMSEYAVERMVISDASEGSEAIEDADDADADDTVRILIFESMELRSEDESDSSESESSSSSTAYCMISRYHASTRSLWVLRRVSSSFFLCESQGMNGFLKDCSAHSIITDKDNQCYIEKSHA